MSKRPTSLVPIRSSDTVMQTLAWVRKQGFRPVPLHPKSKAAISRDYVSVDYRPPGDELWQTSNYGVGIATGPMHSGPVDADLDCHEAVVLADYFLPKTKAVFGRKSKKRSHLLYRVDTPTFEKLTFIDPVNNQTILELRGDAGHQTVMPGSLHQDTGELIEWHDAIFPEVTTVSTEALIKAARKIAIATVLLRYVWQPGHHNEPTKYLSGMFFYLEWPVDDAIDMIQTLMDASGDTDKSRIPTVKSTYKKAENDGKVAGQGVMRKTVKNDALVDRILEWAGSKTVNIVQEYNEKYAAGLFNNKFRIAMIDVQPGETLNFVQKDDWLNSLSTDLSDDTDSKGNKKSKARVWLTSPRHRTFKSVEFLPGKEDTGNVLNLWTGWAVEPKEGDCSAWLELVRDVICDGDKEKNDWLLHWFANVLREPMVKPATAPVFIGVEGAGKTLAVSYFGKILGRAFVSVTNDEHIHGKFNSHLATALMLHSEEALYAGDKKHASVIRSLITDEHAMLEHKGVDARQIRSFLRVVLTSNDLAAAPVKPGDRRYGIFNLGDRKVPPALIERLLAEKKGDGPAALHHFLIMMNYDPKIARTTIKDDSLLELKSVNLSPLEAWWLSTLKHGQVLPDMLTWAQGKDGAIDRFDWPEQISSPALYMSMASSIRASGGRGIPNESLFAISLNKFVAMQLKRSQRMYEVPRLDDEYPPQIRQMNARQNSITNMPSLADCRAAFEKHLGQKCDWPTDDPTPRFKKPSKPKQFEPPM